MLISHPFHSRSISCILRFLTGWCRVWVLPCKGGGDCFGLKFGDQRLVAYVMEPLLSLLCLAVAAKGSHCLWLAYKFFFRPGKEREEVSKTYPGPQRCPVSPRFGVNSKVECSGLHVPQGVTARLRERPTSGSNREAEHEHVKETSYCIGGMWRLVRESF